MEKIEINKINDLLDEFITILKQLTKTHPYFVIIFMHEYFRNIWPNDPNELSNIYDENLEIVKNFKEQLLYYLKFLNKDTKLS